MGTNIFYSIVKEYAEALLSQRPDCAAVEGSAICAILTGTHDIFAGVTGISLCNNMVQSIPAEYMAVTAMNNAGQTKALQMITLSLSDFSVMQPESIGVSLVLESDPENNKCEIFISERESVNALEFIGIDNSVQNEEVNNETYGGESVPEPVESEDFSDGFDEQEKPENKNNAGSEAFEKMEIINNSTEENRNSSLGAPADFSSGFDIDESNPFYEPPSSGSDVKAVSTIADSMPSAQNKDSSVSASRSSSNQKEMISKNDLIKQAKKKKKIAKANFGFRKK